MLFRSIVKVAKDGLEGKITKQEAKATVKTEEKKAEVKEDAKDLTSLTLADLKAMAKDKGIAGYSSMKKADLIAALK